MVSASHTDFVKLLVAVRDQSNARKTDANLAFLNYAIPRLIESKSQYLQDLWVAYMSQSRPTGYFVEFGGADGVKLSNTWYLENVLGWRGVIAEPGRVWYPAIRRNRACHIDERCVWSRSGETLTFVQSGIAVNSTLEAFVEADALAHERQEHARYEVKTVSLNDLLVDCQAPARIDYMSVDTEGSEFDILSAFDFDRWDVRLITVEHNNTDKRQALYDLLTSRGYQRTLDVMSGVEDWYVKTYA